MEYHVIDLENDPRRDHFHYFNTMGNPYAGMTVEVDITDFQLARKQYDRPFFLSFLYCAGRAANHVVQLRHRIVNDQIVEFDSCDTSHTVMRANGTYSYCRLDCMLPFNEYIEKAVKLHAQAEIAGDIEDGEKLSLLFVSCMPWMRYTSVLQPTPIPADSNPRLLWGKYETRDGRTTMPVTLMVNHALADGLHMARFYQELEKEMAMFAATKAYTREA